ncbi:MAG: hypothetical protein EBT63_07000, partial [Proteobacteria bacterium]|nr:hypothetical protein [Pseudomonadota bacterium]
MPYDFPFSNTKISLGLLLLISGSASALLRSPTSQKTDSLNKFSLGNNLAPLTIKNNPGLTHLSEKKHVNRSGLE